MPEEWAFEDDDDTNEDTSTEHDQSCTSDDED